MPSSLTFTADDFAPSWADARTLLPALRDAEIAATASTGSSPSPPTAARWSASRPDVDGFWIAEAVWVTHSAGVARAVAAAAGRRPLRDLPGRLRRAPVRGRSRLTDAYVRETAPAELRRGLRHPAPAAAQGVAPRSAGQPVPRPADASSAPSSSRPAAGSGRTGTRPTPACSAELPTAWQPPERDAWAARFSSPIAAVEAWKTRTAVAMFDMTPLKRLEVTGPGAVDAARSGHDRQRGAQARRGDLLPDARRRRRHPHRRHRRPPRRRDGSRSAPTGHRHRLPDAGGAAAHRGGSDPVGAGPRHHRRAPAASVCGDRWPARSSAQVCADDLSATTGRCATSAPSRSPSAAYR